MRARRYTRARSTVFSSYERSLRLGVRGSAFSKYGRARIRAAPHYGRYAASAAWFRYDSRSWVGDVASQRDNPRAPGPPIPSRYMPGSSGTYDSSPNGLIFYLDFLYEQQKNNES